VRSSSLDELGRLAVFNRDHYFSAYAFVFTLTLLGIITALYLVNIIKWFEYPDLGFSLRSATGLKIVGVVRDHGLAAGMRVGDRIIKVNGQTYATIDELRKILYWRLGLINRYLVERDGIKLEIHINNLPSGWKRSLKISGVPLLFGFCYLFIGTIVFLMKPHKRSSWIFYLCTSMFGLLLVYFNPLGKISPTWLENPDIFSRCFAPALFIHLALCFPTERKVLQDHPWIQLFPHLFSLILFILMRQSGAIMAYAPKHWQITSVVYMALGVFTFIGSCVQLRFTSESPMVKLRSRMVLLGFTIAASLPLTDFIANAFFQVYLVPNFSYYMPFFIVFPAFVGYSIVKHNLFEIDTIIKRTYGYILTTGTVAGLYGLFVLMSNIAFLHGYEFTKSPVFTLSFLLAIVFLFNPIRNKLQKVVDKVFYRLEYDYRETVQKISETMRSLIGLDEIGKNIMETALGTMFIDSGSVLLLNREKKSYECLTHSGRADESKTLETSREIQHGETSSAIEDQAITHTESRECQVMIPGLAVDEPFVKKITTRKKEITLYDIEEDPYFAEEKNACADVFKSLDATLIVPLIYENNLIGMIPLGRKKSGKFYRREDIDLLNVLANQGAVAIENALMIEEVIEKERMEEELSIARDLQLSMLPAQCPQIDGFEIAATSLPAREVGGDFYDFIDLGEHKAGFVIGDVTGKSVSGALVVSAARSVLRMLAEEHFGLGDIMDRANRRAKKDLMSGMFIALLYAQLDAKTKTLSLCSAGQTQPILLQSETGRARLVETEGDTFPLGLIADVDYRETNIKLCSGDKLIFYTDGIVEAVNESSEMYGFERFLALVEQIGTESADGMLSAIQEDVKRFVGQVDQHDDLTVIVLNTK